MAESLEPYIGPELRARVPDLAERQADFRTGWAGEKLEAVRAGTAPAAILTTGVDSFFALASIVADEMYEKPIPLIALEPDDFATLRSGAWLTVQEDGTITETQ